MKFPQGLAALALCAALPATDFGSIGTLARGEFRSLTCTSGSGAAWTSGRTSLSAKLGFGF